MVQFLYSQFCIVMSKCRIHVTKSLAKITTLLSHMCLGCPVTDTIVLNNVLALHLCLLSLTNPLVKWFATWENSIIWTDRSRPCVGFLRKVLALFVNKPYRHIALLRPDTFNLKGVASERCWSFSYTNSIHCFIAIWHLQFEGVAFTWLKPSLTKNVLVSNKCKQILKYIKDIYMCAKHQVCQIAIPPENLKSKEYSVVILMTYSYDTNS